MNTNITTVAILTSLMFSMGALSKTVNTADLERENSNCRGPNQQKCLTDLKQEIDKQKDKSFNVVLIPLESDYGEDSAKTATNELKSALLKDNIRIVDRKISDEINSEIIAIAHGGESKGIKYSYADFAIKGEVTGHATDRFYKPAQKDCDHFGTDCPERCQVVVDSTVRLSIFNTNPLEIDSDFTISAKTSEIYNGVSENSCLIKEISQDMRKGIKNVFVKNSHIIADSFGSDAYVTGIRTNGKKHYVRTQLEKSGKYPKNSKAEIIQQIEVNDPLLGKTVESRTVAKGKIIETRGDNFVWIEIDRKSDPKDVLISDIVEIKAKKQGCSVFDIKCAAGLLTEVIAK